MVDKLNYKYLYRKRDVYYFSKQIPKDIRSHYLKDRMIICLRTKCPKDATKLRDSILSKLNSHWLNLRMQNDEIPGISLLKNSSNTKKINHIPRLSEALQTYFKLKGSGKGEIFFRASRRVVRDVISLLKDRSLDEYTTTDASRFRDHLLSRGLVSSTVRRVFSIIRAIINLSIQEHGLECKNAFAKRYIPDLEDSIQRMPIPLETIKVIQQECMKINDPNRWLIALLSDTGMRLSEALGLKMEDIKLNEKIPHINLIPNSTRKLKTKSSSRQIPLVGAALWAANQISLNVKDEFAFPHYTKKEYCHTNSASAALNKWLKPRVPKKCVIHSFRHSMRDRLREINTPSEMIDQIGGWSNQSIGKNYGSGYTLKNLLEAMHKISDD